MLESKYSKPILYLTGYCFFIIIISIVLSISIPRTNLTNLIPIRDIGIEVGLIFILIIPLSSTIGLLIGGYLFAPLFLYVHKKIYGKRVEYGIHEKSNSKFKFFTEGIFASLMAINLSLILTIPPIISISVGGTGGYIDDLNTFLALLMFTTGLASILFSTTWFLMDSGILYSNLKNSENTQKPVEVRSVGRWYGQFLKGYAGVSVVLSYIEFMRLFIPQLANDLSIPLFVMLLIVFVPFPLIIVFPLIPALVISDRLKEHRIRFIRKKAGKMGITSKAEVNFELKK